ncbi:MAG: HypC/HybG/HupF family hydrogenase formation chaperone [Candidatus Aminicenantes bacterium]|nr:HypC/HybG/HupF family hydrogenase formation chaperone [Candidatus Aminicenantes bacterium]MBL7083017.1 HypC/HybG/HupF family hydrogenase formation chaperone [Candidatus Aminicenantes bacterium]
MCLGIPAKVVKIEESNFGKVDYLGTKVKTNLSLIEDVKIGDWVIVHAGFAISKLNEEEAKETLFMLRELASQQATENKKNNVEARRNNQKQRI